MHRCHTVSQNSPSRNLTDLMPAMLALATPHPDPLDAQSTNSADPRCQSAPLAEPESLGRIANVFKAACSLAAPLAVCHVRDSDVLRVDLERRYGRCQPQSGGRYRHSMPIQHLCGGSATVHELSKSMRTDISMAQALALHFGKVDSEPTDHEYARCKLNLALRLISHGRELR